MLILEVYHTRYESGWLGGSRAARVWFLYLCEPQQPPAALMLWRVGCGFPFARRLVAQASREVD